MRPVIASSSDDAGPLQEPRGGLFSSSQDVRGRNAHRPTAAGWRCRPLLWRQSVERIGQGRPLCMDHRPCAGVISHAGTRVVEVKAFR